MWYLEPWSSSFSLLCVLGGEDRLCYQVSLNAVLSFANLSFHLSLIFNRPLSDIGRNCAHRTAFIMFMLYCYVHFTRSCELKQKLVSPDMINIRMGSLNGLNMPNEPTEPGRRTCWPVSTVKQIGWVCKSC